MGIGGHVEPFNNTFDQHKYKGLDLGLTISRDSSSFRVYAQYSSNTFEGFTFLDNLKNNYAAIIGVKGRLTTRKIDIKHFLEGRIYTPLFNSERLASANTIHPQYYFQRDMLTWSRFIELHSTSYPSDIIGLNYNFNGNLNIYKGASIYLKSELSLFQGKNISTAFYPFYNIGYQYKIRNNKLELGISNKIFVDYLATPNFALMKTPFFNLVMIRKLDKW